MELKWKNNTDTLASTPLRTTNTSLTKVREPSTQSRVFAAREVSPAAAAASRVLGLEHFPHVPSDGSHDRVGARRVRVFPPPNDVLLLHLFNGMELRLAIIVVIRSKLVGRPAQLVQLAARQRLAAVVVGVETEGLR